MMFSYVLYAILIALTVSIDLTHLDKKSFNEDISVHKIIKKVSSIQYINMEDAKLKYRDDIKQLQRCNENNIHEIVIVVKKLNMDMIHNHLVDVSDPNSLNYGQHFTRQKIADITINQVSVDKIIEYLTLNNIEIISQSKFGEFITVKTSISKLEKFLDTKFYDFKFDNILLTRSLKYSLPSNLVEHISAVFNTVQFPQPKRSIITNPTISEKDIESSSSKSRKLSSYVSVPGSVNITLLNNFYHITNNTGSLEASQALFESINQTYSTDDLTQFQQYFDLPIESIANDIGGHSAISCDGLYDSNCREANLDVQYIMAVAQNVPTTYYYFNESSWAAWLVQVSNMEDIPSVFSISYSGYEEFTSTSEMEEFNNQAIILGLQGVTLLSASGDDGVAGYFPRMSDLPILCGYHPQFPASSPYVTSIGGTQGPESGNPEIACQAQLGGVITSGGGFSFDFPTPYWQIDAVSNYLDNAPEAFDGFNRNGRGYPDLSAMAVNYLVVVGTKLQPVSGTSASTPVVAGLVTLVNSQRIRAGKGNVGWLNPALYALSSNETTSFTNDITSGINNCVAHATICCAQGFEAFEKWDPNTGLGSVDYAKFETQFVALGNNISDIYSAAPTIVPITPPYPTASPTLQAGWAYINIYNSANCSDVIVTVKGVPTNKCLPHYINNQLVGSVSYTCQNNGLMTSINTYIDDNCSTLILAEDFSSGCASVYEDYTNSYISQELVCEININQTLPLGQLTGSTTVPVWAVEKMYDTQLSSGSCSDESFCGFMAYKNNFCIGYDTSSTSSASYYFKWPYIQQYKTNGFCQGFYSTGYFTSSCLQKGDDYYYYDDGIFDALARKYEWTDYPYIPWAISSNDDDITTSSIGLIISWILICCVGTSCIFFCKYRNDQSKITENTEQSLNMVINPVQGHYVSNVTPQSNYEQNNGQAKYYPPMANVAPYVPNSGTGQISGAAYTVNNTYSHNQTY